jgi:hypothetical protein
MGQALHRLIVERIRRHGVQRLANGPQHQAACYRVLVVAVRKVGQGCVYITGSNHSEVARMPYMRVLR